MRGGCRKLEGASLGRPAALFGPDAQSGEADQQHRQGGGFRDGGLGDVVLLVAAVGADRGLDPFRRLGRVARVLRRLRFQSR